LTRNGSEPTGWQYVTNTTGTPPADSMLIATITTSSGSVIDVVDKRLLKTTTGEVFFPEITAPDFNNVSGVAVYAKDEGDNTNNLYVKRRKADAIVEQILVTGGAF